MRNGRSPSAIAASVRGTNVVCDREGARVRDGANRRKAGMERRDFALRKPLREPERAVRAGRYPRDGAGDAHGTGSFQAYRGSEPPRFVNGVELECARILDWYGIPWEYEPRSFVLERDAEGRVTSAFTPDFYLPEQNLYVEVTVMKQSLVTRKNRKLRELQAAVPGRQGEALLPARHRAARPALPAADRLVSRSAAERLREEGHPIGEVYLAREEIAARVAELGRELAADYAGSRAAARRAAQVEHRLPRRPLASARARPRARHDRAGALRQRPRGGGVRLLKDLDGPLAGRDVLLVEDVVDTGLTLAFLTRCFAERRPASLAAVTLLDRPYRRLVDDLPLRHVGFTVPDELFAGYGLGLDERWRALPDLHLVVADELPAAIDAA